MAGFDDYLRWMVTTPVPERRSPHRGSTCLSSPASRPARCPSSECDRAQRLAAALHERHLTLYGELAHAPVPLVVHRCSAEDTARYVEALRWRLPGAAFERAAARVGPGCGVAVWHYPAAPIRVDDLRLLAAADPQLCERRRRPARRPSRAGAASSPGCCSSDSCRSRPGTRPADPAWTPPAPASTAGSPTSSPRALRVDFPTTGGSGAACSTASTGCRARCRSSPPPSVHVRADPPGPSLDSLSRVFLGPPPARPSRAGDAGRGRPGLPDLVVLQARPTRGPGRCERGTDDPRSAPIGRPGQQDDQEADRLPVTEPAAVPCRPARGVRMTRTHAPVRQLRERRSDMHPRDTVDRIRQDGTASGAAVPLGAAARFNPCDRMDAFR